MINGLLTFSVSDPHTQSRTLHSLQHDGWRRQNGHAHKPRLEPTRLVMGECNIRTCVKNRINIINDIWYICWVFMMNYMLGMRPLHLHPLSHPPSPAKPEADIRYTLPSSGCRHGYGSAWTPLGPWGWRSLWQPILIIGKRYIACFSNRW